MAQTKHERERNINERVGKTQISNWLPKPDSEEIRFSRSNQFGVEEEKRADANNVNMNENENEYDEAEELEYGVIDYANNPTLALDNSENLRPFSPPFAQISSQEKPEKKKINNIKSLSKYEDSLENKIEEFREEDDEKVNVIYDPILKCYYDPKTNSYYQLNDK